MTEVDKISIEVEGEPWKSRASRLQNIFMLKSA